MAETIGLILLGGLETTIFTATAASTGFGSLAVSVPLGGVALFGGVTVAGAVGTAALLGGSLAAGALLQQALPSIPKPSDATLTMRQPIPARPFGYGRARVAGAYMFFEATTAPANSHDVIALHHGRVQGFSYWFLHDDLCSVDVSTHVVSSVYNSGDGRYGSEILLRFRLGEDNESAYSELVTAFPDDWSNDHRGHGIASCHLLCDEQALEDQHERFPFGLPRVSVAADLTRIYDPRDPNQDPEDPDTWLASRNPVIQLLDYVTSADHGLGLDWDDFVEPVIDDLMTQADYCDELVLRDDGAYEPRYASSGFAFLVTDPTDVISALLSTCDGWMTENPQGTLALHVGKYVAPTVTFTDDHIVGFTMDHGVADEDQVNEIRFSYTPPANDFVEADGEPWRDEESIAELGRIRSNSMQMTWVHSHTQARRLAKRAMARHQATLRGTLTTTLYGLKALGQRWVAVRSGIITDLANAVIEVSRVRVDLQNARLSFEWVLVNPNAIDAWDETEEEGVELTLNYPDLVTSAPTGMVLTDIGNQQVEVAIDTPHNPSLRYQVRVNPPGAPPEYSVDVPEPFIHANVARMRIQLEDGAGSYGVRIAFVNHDGSLSTFTSVVGVAIA